MTNSSHPRINSHTNASTMWTLPHIYILTHTHTHQLLTRCNRYSFKRQIRPEKTKVHLCVCGNQTSAKRNDICNGIRLFLLFWSNCKESDLLVCVCAPLKLHKSQVKHRKECWVELNQSSENDEQMFCNNCQQTVVVVVVVRRIKPFVVSS